MNHHKYWKTELPMALSALCISAAAFAAYPRLPTDAQLLSEVYGSYAPGGDCQKQPRIHVDKTGIHLDTAAGKRGPLPMSVSLTWIGGARYSGIQTWALIKHGGKDRYGDDKTPVVLTFNAGEKRGVLTAGRTGPGKERPATLDGPLNSIVQAAGFRLCRAGSLPIDR